MALTERLAVVVSSQGVDGVVRDFNRLGGAAAKAGADVETGLSGRINRGLKSIGVESAVSGAALKSGIAAGATIAGAAMVRFGLDAVSAASDLNEQMAATEATFGSAAGKVLDFGEKAHSALNLTNTAALQAANNFGAFFKAAGADTDQAAKFSTQMVRLASDLTSFKNIPMDEALQRLQSGLAGEAEPLRRIGVFLTASSVNAKAAELGFKSVHGEVSEGAKILARYQLILEGTRDAQGDLERTAGSLANQQREFEAGVAELQAEIGQGLLPVMLGLVGVGNKVIATLDKMGDGTSMLSAFIANVPGLNLFALAGHALASAGEGAKDLGKYADITADDLANLGWSANFADEELGDLLGTSHKLVDLQRRQADATNSVAEAQRQLAEDRAFNSAAAVSKAEDDVTRARVGQERATQRLGDAQARLNELRAQDPAKIIADAERAQADAAADLARAQQDVVDTTDALNRLRDIGASPNEIARGELAVTDANNAVADAQAAAAESADALNRARTGEDRRKQIADAERDVTDATLAVRDATRQTADAQDDLNAARGAGKAAEIARDEDRLRRAIDDQARATGELAGAHGNNRAAIEAELSAYRALLSQLGPVDTEIATFINNRIAELQTLVGLTPGAAPPGSTGELPKGPIGPTSSNLGALFPDAVSVPPTPPSTGTDTGGARPAEDRPFLGSTTTINQFYGLYVDEVERKAAAVQRTRNLLRG